MARIMYFHITGCIFLNIGIHTVFAYIHNDCPIACECPPETKMVKCDIYGYWNELPNIPSGTNYTSVYGGSFGTLKRPSKCSNYRLLVTLYLTQNKITSIAEDAFKCMSRLKHLTIEDNALQTIPRSAFHHVPYLSAISLKKNNLTAGVIPSLCIARKLRRINLQHNRIVIKPRVLECLGSLKLLSYIDLSSNFISTAKALQPLQNVTNHIAIAECGIKHIEDDTFKGFKLQILDLSHNDLTHVPGSLKNMKELILLNLKENSIADGSPLTEMASIETQDLSNNCLSQFPNLNANLRKLFLSYNNIHNLTNQSLSHLSNLETLALRNTKINYIESGAFYNLQRLKFLDVAQNNIADSNLSAVLSHLVHCPLTTLVLSDNEITILDEQFKVLWYKNRLKRLERSSCNIEKILPAAFAYMPYLEALDLSYNSFSHIYRYGLAGLPNLKFLFLSKNLIWLDGAITGLQKSPLIQLDLSFGKMYEISLQNISTLETINLSFNQITRITATSFKNLTSLSHLDLSSNRIISIAKGALELPSLSYLSLGDNFLEEKYVKLPEILPNLADLYTFDLGGADIGSLHQQEQIKIWAKMHLLNSLTIIKCKIQFLFAGMFSPLLNLHHLSAADNRISFIEPLAFQNVSRLTTLDLEENSITYVNWEIFSHVPQLRFLSLSENPLLCTCEVLWILQAVRVPRWVIVRDHEKLACRKTSPVETIRLNELDLTVSDCEEQWPIILKPVGIGLAILVIMLLTYITWHYRWHIRYTLFLARAGRGRYQEMHDDHNYAYDAFVAYSSEDLPWVKHYLLPNIDSEYIGEAGFKLCLHDRDWLAGIDIAENIVNSIAESRRTIIVLSKDFAASEWCQYELAMAHLRLNSEGFKKDRLLIILLNDIPTRLLTPRLIYYLTSKTYLPWKNDQGLHENFWKTLRKSLQKKLLYH